MPHDPSNNFSTLILGFANAQELAVSALSITAVA
jgi:hypothetical protein